MLVLPFIGETPQSIPFQLEDFPTRLYREGMNTKTHGFTLIELMITLVIVAVLLTIGIPSYNTMMRNNCLLSTNAELVGTLHYARLEAARRGVAVTVRALNAGDSGNEWGTGWWIYVSGSTTRLREVNRTDNRVCENTTINEENGVVEFVYRPDGSTDQSGGNTFSDRLEFNICDDRTDESGNQVVVEQTGRAITRGSTDGFSCQ